jgi:hypothetical protein
MRAYAKRGLAPEAPIPMNDHVELFVRVDNRAFTLQDERATWNGVWTNRTVLQDSVGLAPGIISVADATRGKGEAPVLVELADAAPPDADVDDYDGVVEAPLEAPSGKLRFVSGTEVIPVGSVTPGSYRVRVYYGNADAADFDGDSGADHYRIAVWPAGPNATKEVKVRVPKPRFDVWESKYYGHQTRPQLTAWLEDNASATSAVSHRCLATVALLRLGDLGIVQKAQEKETSRAVQAVYASSLWLANEDAVQTLASLTLSPNRETRRRAVQSLARVQGPFAWKLVLSLTDDPDASVRAAVVAAQADRHFRKSGGAAGC